MASPAQQDSLKRGVPDALNRVYIPGYTSYMPPWVYIPGYTSYMPPYHPFVGVYASLYASLLPCVRGVYTFLLPCVRGVYASLVYMRVSERCFWALRNPETSQDC